MKHVPSYHVFHEMIVCIAVEGRGRSKDGETMISIISLLGSDWVVEQENRKKRVGFGVYSVKTR